MWHWYLTFFEIDIRFFFDILEDTGFEFYNFQKFHPPKFYSNSPNVISGSLQKKLNLRIMALSEALDQFALSDNHVRNCIDLIKSDDVQKVRFCFFLEWFSILLKVQQITSSKFRCLNVSTLTSEGQKAQKVGFAEPWKSMFGWMIFGIFNRCVCSFCPLFDRFCFRIWSTTGCSTSSSINWIL